MDNQSIPYFKEKIQLLLAAYANSKDGIGKYRHEKYSAINDFYLKNGFPKKCSEISYSVIPAIFQEAIYDGINWSVQNADLGHLEYHFEIDCIFNNEGKRRQELSDTAFAVYVNFLGSVIKHAKNADQ